MPHIIIAADHAGVSLKRTLITHLERQSFTVTDCGTQAETSVDYPDMAYKVVDAIITEENENDAVGILICGSGIGISIAANRHPKIRAALCHNIETATLAREHNDANILVMGARIIEEEVACAMVDCFLRTEFAAGRHVGRVEKLQHHPFDSQ